MHDRNLTVPAASLLPLLPFPAVLPETKMARAEAQEVIDDIGEEAAELPETMDILGD